MTTATMDNVSRIHHQPDSPKAQTVGIVVLDTCVLLTDPEALFGYPHTDIVLPLTVIEELDGQKTRMDEVGKAARTTLRTLERLRVANDGTLLTPVELGDGATLRIETNGLLLDELDKYSLDPAKPDNRILAAALGLARTGQVRLVTQDTALRVKASQLSIAASEHAVGRRVTVDSNITRVGVTDQVSADLHHHHAVPLDVAFEYSPTETIVNQPVICTSPSGASTLTRVKGGHLVPLDVGATAWGLHPKSPEQFFALDLLTDPSVPIVTLSGPAGTGKTVVALAAALEQVFETNQYDRLLILRPMVSVGRQDVGFLPGDLAQKLGPWFEAIVDAVVALSNGATSYAAAREQVDMWCQQDMLMMEPVTYLRGRSLQNTFVIVDEAQNLEPLVAKTVLTRLGEGSKAVMLGDTSQIDSPWLSESSNALAAVVEALEDSPLFGHVTLVRGERSAAAKFAAERL